MFTLKAKLNQHMVIHAAQKPYVCHESNKSFRLECDLNNHVYIHTEEKPHVCEVCNKSFRHKLYLKSHMLIHTGEKPYVCKVCNKSFRENCVLKRHLLVHTGERPHICEVCNKSFAKKCVLNDHMCIHTGEKPHMCEVCNKSFRHKGVLNRHLLIHTGEKPHMCEVCNKSFRDKAALNKHMLIHTGEKSHVCEILSRDKYCTFIEDVKRAKAKQEKESDNYRRLRKCDVIEVDGKEKLIVPVTEDSSVILYYVHTEELFDLLHDTHLKIGHGGRTQMEKKRQTKFKNVTKEIITLYLSLCKPCLTKLSYPKNGLVSKPLIFKEFNSRCQVALIDMQSNPDGEFKFILNSQDHLTKFILLRALKSKRAEEVAYQLLDVFSIMGAPNVLQ
ncbi:KRAB-A domain-containing protein 2, partial [Stegodyphus mimosarum]